MPKLKPVSGLKIIKALGKAGFQVVGRKGSHVRLKKKTSDSMHNYYSDAFRNKDRNS